MKEYDKLLKRMKPYTTEKRPKPFKLTMKEVEVIQKHPEKQDEIVDMLQKIAIMQSDPM